MANLLAKRSTFAMYKVEINFSGQLRVILFRGPGCRKTMLDCWYDYLDRAEACRGRRKRATRGLDQCATEKKGERQRRNTEVRPTRRWSGMDSNVQFRAVGSSELGPISARRSSGTSPASVNRSSCRAVRGAATHSPDQRCHTTVTLCDRIAELKF